MSRVSEVYTVYNSTVHKEPKEYATKDKKKTYVTKTLRRCSIAPHGYMTNNIFLYSEIRFHITFIIRVDVASGSRKFHKHRRNNCKFGIKLSLCVTGCI